MHLYLSFYTRYYVFSTWCVLICEQAALFVHVCTLSFFLSIYLCLCIQDIMYIVFGMCCFVEQAALLVHVFA